MKDKPEKKSPNRAAVAEAILAMGEDDLRYLNRLIVERLKLIAQARSTVLMAQFSTGDCVTFRSPNGEQKHGVVLRLNKKTVSVQTDDGHRWRIAPGFLESAGAGDGGATTAD
ncbi:MAG: hypothetical protein R6V58_04520 [Planctomycetota bacterium]